MQIRSQRQFERGFGVVRSWTGTKDIRVGAFKPTRHAVFLVNRQLSSEAAVVLARIEKVDYQLDVIMLNEVYLLPTWILLPKQVLQVQTLTCNFRIAGAVKPRELARGYRGFQMGDGAGPSMMVCLAHLDAIRSAIC